MRTQRLLPALLTILALAVAPLATGCGDDDNGSSTDGGDGSPGNGDDGGSGLADGDAPSDGPADAPSDGPADADGATTEPPEPTLDNVHATIFATDCVACHNPNLTEEGLDLTNDATLRDRLLVNANQLLSMPLVDPGDPDNSYLFRKVENTHIAAGGTGDSMPTVYDLTPDQIAFLRQWILDGAPQ